MLCFLDCSELHVNRSLVLFDVSNCVDSMMVLFCVANLRKISAFIHAIEDRVLLENIPRVK